MALRAIIAAQAFSACGTLAREYPEDRSADAAPLAAGAVVLVRGDNLASTLLLNLHQYNPIEGEPFAVLKEYLPSWESEAETMAEDRVPSGYLDLLTWQSRRVVLVPSIGANGYTMVSGVVIMKGNQFPDEWPHRRREPLVAFRLAAKPRNLRDVMRGCPFRSSRGGRYGATAALFSGFRPSRTSQPDQGYFNG